MVDKSKIEEAVKLLLEGIGEDVDRELSLIHISRNPVLSQKPISIHPALLPKKHSFIRYASAIIIAMKNIVWRGITMTAF